MRISTRWRYAAVALTGTLLGGFGAATASAEPAQSNNTLGPYGYQTLTLGMDENDAMATGLITHEWTRGQCHFYNLVPSAGNQDPADNVVIFSPSRSLVSIPGTDAMHTPQGVRMYSSDFTEIKRVYPDLHHPQGQPDFIYDAAVPSNPAAHYRFVIDTDNSIKDIALASNDGGGCE